MLVRTLIIGGVAAAVILGLQPVTHLAIGAGIDPTRGYAAGGGLLALVCFVAGFGLGWTRERPGVLLLPGLALGVIGQIAIFTTPELSAPSEGAWSFAATIAGPAAFLVSGWSMGRRSDVAGLGTSVLGAFAWGGLTWGWVLMARRLYVEPEQIAGLIAVGALLDAALVGFGVSVARRTLAIVEIGVIVAILGFGLFLAVALGPAEWLAAFDAPAEQILVALGLFPALALSAFFAVGGSLGFLFFGGGRWDPGFGVEARLALRYLKAHRRDGFVGIVTVVAVVGVCLGVMALIIVLSIMSGFEADLKSKILAAHAHIVVGKHGDDFVEFAEVEEQARSVEGVTSAAAFVLGDAMISTDISLSGTIVKGLDPNNRASIAELSKDVLRGSVEYLSDPSMIPGACPSRRRWRGPPSPGTASATTSTAALTDPPVPPPPSETASAGPAPCGRVLPGIIVGRELARMLSAYVGDVVKLVSPVSDDIGPMGPMPKLRRFRIAGVFFSGMYEYDAKFSYVAMDDAQRFFGLPERATGVEIKIAEVDRTSRSVESIRGRLGGAPYTVRDWRDMNRELFSALLLEKIAMFVVLAMIVTVASFLIVATLVMIVLQRGKEIAILKSMGASDASIMKVFVIQGLFVGVGGAVLGVVLGIVVCWILQTVGFPLDDRVFYIEKLPVVLDQREISIIALAAVIISYLATIYPAMTAAQLYPVQGLRDE